MRSSTYIFLVLLGSLSANAVAVPVDPGGVAGLIVVTIVVAPLIFLILIGAFAAGIRGVAGGLVIYVIGFVIVMYPAHQRSQQNLIEYEKESEVWSRACLQEAGEYGEPISGPVDKVLVHIDPLLEGYWAAPKFAGKDAAPWTQFISSAQRELTPGQVLVDIQLIDRSIEGAGTRRLEGFETVIKDSAGRLVGKRINFIRASDSCLAEREERAVEGFLRRTLGIQSVLFSSVRAEELVTTEYPIGKLYAPEKGVFAPNPAIRTGNLNTIVPSAWGCKFDKNVGGPDLIKCPDSANNLVHDQDLQWAKAVVDTGSTWVVLIDPALTNNANNGYLDRAVFEHRDRNGHPLKRIMVRFPRIEGLRFFTLADVQIMPDRMEVVLFTKVCSKPQGPTQPCERIRLSIPTQEVNEHSG